MPKPSQWNGDRLNEFLNTHTLELDPKDRNFLDARITAYGNNLSLALKRHERRAQADLTIWSQDGWEGLVPCVRLIHIVLSDELRTAFVERDQVLVRRELDARGTESERPGFWKLVLLKFNDRTYAPKSAILHVSWGAAFFMERHDLGWDEMDDLKASPLADEKAAKTRFQTINNALGAVYKLWSQSGNGDDMCGRNNSMINI